MRRRATIYLDEELHRALRLKAAATDRTISEIVSAAVQRDLAEDAEDLTAFQKRKDQRTYSFESVVQALRERGEGRSEERVMKHEFTAIFERDGDWYIGYCPEIPGANGQGKTKSEARKNLADAIVLILEDRREDGLRGLPDDVERETVTLE